MRPRILIPLLIAILGVYGVLKSSLDSRMEQRRLTQDLRYLPNPKTASLMATGYKMALADITWIEALNYFGGQLIDKNRSYKYLDSYLAIILKLDPLFRMFYEWAATAFIYNGLQITKSSLVQSMRYINDGIKALAARGIYDENIIAKGAFNFAFEAHDFKNSIPYFELAARSSRARRDFLLIGATYARHARDEDKSRKMKLEFLAFTTFEAQNQEELRYALQVLTSGQFDAQAASYVKSFRLQIEKDEKIKELIQQRFASSPLLRSEAFEDSNLQRDYRLENLMRVNTRRNWLPADLHLLLNL